MINTCRLCLDEIFKKLINENNSQYEKIKLLMPEIDINLFSTFSLCINCEQSLNSAYIFKCVCIQTEDFIKEYIKTTKDVAVDLGNIRNQRLSSVQEVIYQQEIKIEENDINIDDKSLVNIPDIKSEVNQEYICHECSKHFSSHDEFQNHIEVCLVYLSSHCEQVFSSRETAKNHQLSHVKVRFVCEVCEKSFNRNYDLKQHQCKVHFVSSVSLKCNECGVQFLNEKTLRVHKLTHLNQEKKYFCDVCNNGYNKLSTLVKHKALHLDKKHDCTLCSKSFNSSVRLHRHMAYAHFGTHICDTCGMKCGAKSVLEEHLRIHTGEKPFKCEICGMGFAQNSSLRIHKQCVHSTVKPYVCDKCDKAFTLRRYLRLHRETHTVNVKKNFVCSMCGKTFGTSNNLRNHVRRHLSPKNHKCSLCDKEFFTPHDLRKHMTTHTGERPYECHTCHKKFSRKYNLQVHFKSHRPKSKPLKISHNNLDST